MARQISWRRRGINGSGSGVIDYQWRRLAAYQQRSNEKQRSWRAAGDQRK